MAKGGALKPVYIVTDEELEINGGDFVLQQGPALKVRGFTLDNYANRRIQSGAAQPVYVVPEASAPSLHGGHWRVIAGQPVKVLSVTNAERNIIQGPAVPVYPVDDAGNYDPNFAGVPFSPTDLAGLYCWYKADAETIYADGNVLTVVTDQSGNGINLTAINNTPTWEDNEINGRAVYRFRTNEWARENVVDVAAGYRATFVVTRTPDVTIAENSIMAAMGQDWRTGFSGTGLRTFVNGVGDFDFNTGWVAADTPYVVSFYVDGANYYVRINGVTRQTGAYVHPVAILTWYVLAQDGVSKYGDQDIMELIHYNSDVSAYISQIESYLAGRAGITL